VTCAHVVRDVGEDFIEADGKPAKIVCCSADDVLDLAVIKTDKLIDKPVIRLAECGGANVPFLITGFRAFGRNFAVTELYGKVVRSQGLESRTYAGRVNTWILAIDNNDRLPEGHSGSPVIDSETGCCFGVVKDRLSEQTGSAVSVEELGKIWLDMPIVIERMSQSQSSYQERLIKQAYQSFIAGDLGQALDLFNRVKSFDPFYPQINTMIRTVEGEMRKPYVDRYGRVNEEKVATQIQIEASKPKLKPKPAPLFLQTWIIWLFLLLLTLLILINVFGWKVVLGTLLILFGLYLFFLRK
jgi:hypothetical protein